MEKRAMQEEKRPAFDFDEWCELAQKDPEKFERKRKAVIEDFISSTSHDNEMRLRQLQWRIDMERKRCRNPMESCLKIFDMMWDFVHADRGFLYAVRMLEQVASGTPPAEDEVRGGSVDTVVLPFSLGSSCSARQAGPGRH